MPPAFLDTNVFLYAAMRALPEPDGFKKPMAEELLARGDFGASTQVLAEFYYNARRKGSEPLSHVEAMEWLELIAEQPCAVVDPDLIRAGAALAEQHRISYWDGAILAAAHAMGADTLYTEDLSDGQRYGDVTVVNPFQSLAQ